MEMKFFAPTTGQRLPEVTDPKAPMRNEIVFRNDNDAYTHFSAQDSAEEAKAKELSTSNLIDAVDPWGRNLYANEVSKSVNEAWGSALADQGRGTDSMIAHVTPGETLIPPEVLDRFPELEAAIAAAFQNMGGDHREFRVGSDQQKINPLTGQPEFFGLGKIFKGIKKIVKKVMSNPITAAAATVASGGALAPIVGSTALGAGIASAGLSLASGNSIGTSLLSGATAGIGSGAASTIGSKIAGGALGTTAGNLSTNTIGSILNNSGFGGAVSSALMGEGVGSKLVSGLLDTSVGDYIGAIATGLGSGGAGNVPKATAPSGGGGSATTLPAAASSLPSAKSTKDATGSNAGAGAVPFSPNAVDTLASKGVSFINPVRNRDTGEVDYSESPFSNSLRNVRRGSWGGSFLQV